MTVALVMIVLMLLVVRLGLGPSTLSQTRWPSRDGDRPLPPITWPYWSGQRREQTG
ncbi:hypothetical protein HC028_19360 [Planosporangium flavigriseum]|uniref:hypothetical protein n=1 Tax=Planosporangium flavigriseum TaxID=373681 RepID=UPI00143B71F7|nr:hypothetical protein [Planosporangium flavigriseum]NJC66649.1 hypothetical protein [Planosporangium flavigriseum]